MLVWVILMKGFNEAQEATGNCLSLQKYQLLFEDGSLSEQDLDFLNEQDQSPSGKVGTDGLHLGFCIILSLPRTWEVLYQKQIAKMQERSFQLKPSGARNRLLQWNVRWVSLLSWVAQGFMGHT